MIAALLAAVALAAPAPRVLARYEPTFVLHPTERFRPTVVDAFVAASDVVAGHYDVRGCTPRDGLPSVECYAAAFPSQPPAVYAAAHRAGPRTVLQYWLFYDYDFWSPTVPPRADFWKAHEGDWEVVVVLLDAAQRPILVGTSRHCSGARRPWKRVQRAGTHPIVYVAAGAHANYFGAGAFLEQRRCWGDIAPRIYDAYHVKMLDHTARGATIRPRLLSVGAPLRFPGAWGEDLWVGFPNNQIFKSGTSPSGPPFKDDWRRPLAAVLEWPQE